MNHPVDYEYEAMKKKEAQRQAIKAENKRELRSRLMAFLLLIGLQVALFFAGSWYREWLWRDFTPPPELLTEAEFRELVEGYPLLAEAYGCCYKEDMDTVIRGDLDRYEDLDADGEWDVRVWFPLHGRYETEMYSYEHRDGKDAWVGYTYELREEEPFKLNAFAYRYSIFDLGKGVPHTPWEEHIFGGDHTAYLSITVRDPSSDHAEFRAAVEELLHIVRGE